MFALVLVAAVLWVLCGIPAALIAHVKGRNAVMWAVLGSAFGIVGLAAIACAPARSIGGPWDIVTGDSIHFGGFGGFDTWGSSGDWGASGGSDFGFGDFGGSGDGGGCGGGGD